MATDTDIPIGSTAKCHRCGRHLVYNGQCWSHGPNPPRHIAVPVDIVTYRCPIEYGSNCVRVIERAAAHLHIDPAVLAERLAALPGGGIGELVDAVNALMTMRLNSEQPRKLDDSITWRENDELAESLAHAALKPFAKE